MRCQVDRTLLFSWMCPYMCRACNAAKVTLITFVASGVLLALSAAQQTVIKTLWSRGGQLMPICCFSHDSHLIPPTTCLPGSVPVSGCQTPTLPTFTLSWFSHAAAVYSIVCIYLPVSLVCADSFFFLASPRPKNAWGFSRGKLSVWYVAPWAGSERNPVFLGLASLPVPWSHPKPWCHDRHRVRTRSGVKKLSPVLVQPDLGVLVAHLLCTICFVFF